MLINLLIKGIASGFSLAAPGGAIGFLCIKETSKNGVNPGLIAGLGAATADMLYGILAAVVLKMMDGIVTSHELSLTIISGIFFCYMGVERLFSTSSLEDIKPIPGKLLHIYLYTILLTLKDFSSIVEFIALFIAFDININELQDSIGFVIGVFLGAAIWWFLLCFMDTLLHKKTSMRLLRYVNYITSIIIFIFGLHELFK